MRIACERLGIWSAVVAVVMAVGCATSGAGGATQATGACDAGAVVPCACADGTASTQTCSAISSQWGACSCPGSSDSSIPSGDGTLTPSKDGGASGGGDATSSSSGGGTSSSSGGGTSSSSGGGTSSSGGSSVDSGAPGDAYDWDVAPRTPAPHPPIEAGACGSWAEVDNVCCAQYCSTDNTSDSCGQCAGTAACVPVNSKACVSGQWPEVHSVSDSEPWHYSRSTHFGETTGGACQFGYYGVCSSSDAFNKTMAGCEAFCSAYPDLCAEPDGGLLLRGNFAAPSGNYYTQFWSSLPGTDDNYLSCGECFELVRTNDDGTDIQPTDPGYTPPFCSRSSTPAHARRTPSGAAGLDGITAAKS